MALGADRRTAPSTGGFGCQASRFPSARHSSLDTEPTMARITLRQLLDDAAEHGYGVPAFNINNMEQVHRHHGGGEGRRRAGDHAGLARRTPICQRHHAGQDDGCGGRDLSAHPDLRASGPRQQRIDLPHRHPARLHLGDDGRLAQGRRQDAGRLCLQCRHHPPRHRHGPLGAASRSRASSACSARSRAARARRRTATAPRARCRTTSSSPIPTRP